MSVPTSSSPSPLRTVDVLVVGGGPTGLIISYVLLKAGLKIIVIEQYDKAQQAMFGRASLLYPRSLEILDQLGLYDAIAETGYLIRNTTTYKDGKEFANRGWSSIFKVLEGNTHFDYCFGIRQKLSEQAFREAIHGLDSEAVLAPAKLLDFTVNASDEYPVTSTVEINGVVGYVRSKYIVGADGGRSTVRSLAKIPFPGVASPYRWIRLDAVVRTDMPWDRHGSVSLESPSHGNILWQPTDSGRTRIGFICPAELYGRHGEGITADIVMAEAQKALQPFTLNFIKLDWWTVYSIGQRVADRFRDGPILLAGDAGHTHSSGAAQGMNTGIHDASNISWKLAGVLNGWYVDGVLDSYATERRESAQRLIQLDKDISTLISGIIPAHFNAPPNADVNLYFDSVLTANTAFTVGLGIHYEENLINQHNTNPDPVAKNVQVGHRAPDPAVFRPGSKFPRRLQELTPNDGRFWVLVFAGGLDPVSKQPRLCQSGLDRFTALRRYFESPTSFTHILAPAFEFLTIIKGDRILQTSETLGGQPLGKAVYDQTGEAYAKYGIDDAAGGLIVLRPDGIIGFIAMISQYEAVGGYFARFVRPLTGSDLTSQKIVKSQLTTDHAVGEISLEGKTEEAHFSSYI